jgi:hypothetical protein
VVSSTTDFRPLPGPHHARPSAAVGGLGRAASRLRWGAAVRLRADALDRDLAAGADPLASEALVRRARQLGSRRRRLRLAGGLAKARRAAESGSWGLTAAVAPNRREVLAARTALVDVEEKLRRPGPVRACGIALLAGLLTEGGGPLYQPCPAGELRRQLEAIAAALDPTTPGQLNHAPTAAEVAR